jgi:hypothetical protein
MNKETVVEWINTEEFTERHLEEIDRMISAYPWFGLPRFLRLKALHQLGLEPEPGETGKAAVFSNDRSHLYRWIRSETGNEPVLSGLLGSELEFLDSDEEMNTGITGEDDLLQLGEDDREAVENEEADERGIPEKEESDMEEPEIEEPEAVPVMDPLDDEEPEVEEHASTPSSDMPEEEVPEVSGPAGGPGTDLPEEETEDASAGGLPEDEAQEALPVDGMTDTEQESGLPERRESGSGASGNRSANLIEEFLNSEPGVIKADKETSLQGDVSVHSVKEDDSFITDTLAKIYVKQGLHAKAIYAYERLSLKYPEKSAYFAAQIEKIKSITNI